MWWKPQMEPNYCLNNHRPYLKHLNIRVEVGLINYSADTDSFLCESFSAINFSKVSGLKHPRQKSFDRWSFWGGEKYFNIF